MNRFIITVLSSVAISLCGLCAETDIVKVKGKGTGATEELALKDAYRDAVESAVGMFVDAEQMVKNDDLIKDQILTHSNAYVEKRTVLSKEEKDGVVKIKILAEVRKQELTKRIKEVMPSQTVQVGDTLGNVHAQNVTQEKRSMDGCALLEKTLSDLHPALTLVDFLLLSSEPMVKKSRKKSQGGDGLYYPFSTRINAERYFRTFVPQLQGVLAQISLVQPLKKSVSIEVERAVEVSEFKRQFETRDGGRRFERKVSFPGGKGRGGSILRLEKPYNVLLVTGFNGNKTIVNVEMYQVDDACYKLFRNWDIKEMKKRPTYRVVFKDESGESLYQSTQKPSHNECYNMAQGDIYIAPWFFSRRYVCVASSDEWRNIDVPRDAQPSVKSITVELIQ